MNSYIKHKDNTPYFYLCNGRILFVEGTDLSITDLMSHFTGNHNPSKVIDHRVQAVIHKINSPNDMLLSINRLAQQVHLSTSRLSHLFSEEVGIPIKQYLLWRKLYHAGSLIAKGELIAEAAAASFTDAAHFTRQFTKTFGLPPSKIVKTSESMHLISDTIFTR